MSEQPEALRLADELDKTLDFQNRAWEASKELRRLHDRLNKTSERTLIQLERIAALEQVGRQALEALEDYEPNEAHKSITALRERLAQPEQSPLDRMAENARELGLDYEPVQHTKKYVTEQEPEHDYRTRYDRGCYKCGSHYCPAACPEPTHLVAQAPEQSRAERMREAGYTRRPTLREIASEDEQEPVAWWHDMGGVVDLNVSGHGRPLYFAPPRREWVGLTEEEIESACVPLGAAMLSFSEVARAIEAKLKEKNDR